MDTEYYSQYPPGMKMTDGIPGKPFLFFSKVVTTLHHRSKSFVMP